ncbi:alanine racemase [Nocardioides halotolerans]|uniref:alanine racemase n=1 Tax=Nocardioides halotolerans TaxID=433660 RepID=UPI0004063289|nr:alanine racemase [Nocardioides halotolerans]
MALVLAVDGERWRGHLRGYAEATPGLVPVAKGNGYGFTLGRLARKAAWLGADTLAVGTYEELPEVAGRFPGDLLVLTPWRSFHPAPDASLERRVVHTVSRPDDLGGLLAAQPGARFVLELRTSMRRHGMSAQELWGLGSDGARALRGGRLEGVALHLPLAAGRHLAEVERLLTDLVAAGLPTRTVWVSHLTAAELTTLRSSYADLEIRPRIGTDLWLGDRDALRVTATVLDAHPLARGDGFGYRGRTAPRDGTLLVVSGGTAHGIGLESPKGEAGLKARAAVVARSGLDAMGLTRSPFWVDGKQRLFAEPPHMQASMLFLPADAAVPEVGDRVDARVRYTATTFDRVDVG